MNEINKVILRGRLGTKPKTYEGKKDKKLFATFSLATQQSYKDKNDQWQQKATIWHNNMLVFNPKLVDLVKTFNKGALLKVTGSLNYKKFSSRIKGKTVKKDEVSIIVHSIEADRAHAQDQDVQPALPLNND